MYFHKRKLLIILFICLLFISNNPFISGKSKKKKTKQSTELCQDKFIECPSRKQECELAPGMMVSYCPKTCKLCHLRDSKKRCTRSQLNISSTGSFKDNELHTMFKNIEKNFSDKYEISILSKSPWIVTLENFVTDEEIDAIISTNKDNFQRSTAIDKNIDIHGNILGDAVEARTSSTAWCNFPCENNTAVQGLFQRVQEIVQVPLNKFEYMQVLKYQKGQFYKEHYDATQRQAGSLTGPRIMTFFFYLSDVEKGGETYFPLLDIKIPAKKGKAVLWANVNTRNITRAVIDSNTKHEAKSVLKGSKYGANLWFYNYDYRTVARWGCSELGEDK